MLNIYVGKENLPKDKPFIFDVESAIVLVNITDNEYYRRVLCDVEKGRYFDEKKFVDRFDGQLYYTDMSTGAKAAIEIYGLEDKIINCDECGENALRVMSYAGKGNIYLSRRTIALPWSVDCPIYYNGKYYERISLLNDLIG